MGPPHVTTRFATNANLVLAVGAVVFVAVVSAATSLDGSIAPATELQQLDRKGEAIEAALLEFHRHHGRFPSTEEGFVVLELDRTIFVDPRGWPIDYAPTAHAVRLTARGFPDWSLSLEDGSTKRLDRSR